MRAEIFFSLLFWALSLVTAIGAPVVVARDFWMRRKYRNASALSSTGLDTP